MREFLLKRRDPEYKKTKRDDLFSMETGILKQKGRVHFRLGSCINKELAAVEGEGRAFDEYIAGQLAKVDVEDITDEEMAFMRRTMLLMYANPLKNQRAALGCESV